MPMQFTVQSINARQVNTKYGPKNVYSLGTDIGNVKYGWKDPGKAGIAVGTMLEAEVNQTQYGKEAVEGTVKITTASRGIVTATTTAIDTTTTPRGNYTGGAAGRPFPVPKTSGEMAIIRQNALTNAVAAVHHFYDNQPITDETIVPPIMFQEYTDMIIEAAYKFADFSSGNREVAMANELTNRNMGTDELNEAVNAIRGTGVTMLGGE